MIRLEFDQTLDLFIDALIKVFAIDNVTDSQYSLLQ